MSKFKKTLLVSLTGLTLLAIGCSTLDVVGIGAEENARHTTSVRPIWIFEPPPPVDTLGQGAQMPVIFIVE